MTSQLSGLSARKFRRCSPTCVNEAINLSLCLMSSSVSAPFSMARRSVNCDLLFCQWGCPRETTERCDHRKGDDFLGSKPGPSLFNFLNCFVTLNLFWLLSSARVGAAFELALRRICDWPLFNSLGDWLVLVRGPALRSIRSLREGREPGKIEDPTDRIEWASWSRSSGRVDLPRTESHQFESLRGSTFLKMNLNLGKREISDWIN